MSVAIHAFSNKLTAVLMANKEASTAAGAWDKVVKDLGRPLNVYSDYGTEFKKESKQKLDYFDVDKIVSKGHATMAERAIRTLQEALVRRLTAGVGRRNQWHPLLPDLPQYNERPRSTTGLALNVVYDDPEMADRALERMKAKSREEPKRDGRLQWETWFRLGSNLLNPERPTGPQTLPERKGLRAVWH